MFLFYVIKNNETRESHNIFHTYHIFDWKFIFAQVTYVFIILKKVH